MTDAIVVEGAVTAQQVALALADESPRQPVWQVVMPAPTRCICGAQVRSNGELPCGH